MAASRAIPAVVKPRCRPSRCPSAANTVEALRQPISWPSWAWVHPLRWRRARMFAAMTACRCCWEIGGSVRSWSQVVTMSAVPR